MKVSITHDVDVREFANEMADTFEDHEFEAFMFMLLDRVGSENFADELIKCVEKWKARQAFPFWKPGDGMKPEMIKEMRENFTYAVDRNVETDSEGVVARGPCGFTAGPFDTQHEAESRQGAEGDGIFMLRPNGTRVLVAEWCPALQEWVPT